MSKEERLAKDITHALGGSQNISNIIHCMTRVRIKVHNDCLLYTSPSPRD